MASAPPTIFSDTRRIARRKRMLAGSKAPDAASFLLDEMVADVVERLGFLRLQPKRALVVGDSSGALANYLTTRESQVAEADIIDLPDHQAIDLAAPYSNTGFDFIAVLGLLDTVNDLPGALIHIRKALAPGGLAIASFVGAGSLPHLRRAIMAAEPDRPAARMHPLVDNRAAAQLLQRSGWKDPVVDTHELTLRYGSLDRLVADVRELGLGNVLASPAPPLTRTGLALARAAFLANADEDGRVSETLTLLTLSGRRSIAGT